MKDVATEIKRIRNEIQTADTAPTADNINFVLTLMDALATAVGRLESQIDHVATVAQRHIENP